MPGACDGLKVLDFSQGMAGGLATMVLSDFGAEVVKVEPPGGDPFRAWPASLMWNRGKKSVVLDLKTARGRADAQALAAQSDVVVESLRPGTAEKLGIDYAALSAQNAGVVYCSISGFGQYGEFRRYKGYEGVVAAKTGRMQVFAGQTQRPGPVFAAVQTATHGCSQAAVQGILAALLVRDRTGRGQWVQTSLAQGLMAYDLRDLLVRQLNRKDPIQYPLNLMQGSAQLPSLHYLPVQTKDGRWMQMGNLIEHLFQAWLMAIGLFNIYEDPRFMATPALTEENREALRDILLRRMREKTLDEWMEIFVADGNIAAEPFLTTQQALEHPQIVYNKDVVEIDDPGVGRMKQLGLLADLEKTPGRIQGPAPSVGQHTKEILSGVEKPASHRMSSLAARLPKHPLEGITVLELATVIAGPFSAALMADLGARVIKVEPPEGDPYRHLGGGTGTGPVKTTQGKESICIDLKTQEGQDIAHKLIAKSDVLMHNFRPGVPERLSVDYETARAINPNIVYLYAAGYGATGPYSLRPAAHPVPGAAIGGALLQAGQGMPPPPEQPLSWDEVKEVSRWLGRANEVNPDPNTGVVLATAMMLGLYARSRTGMGQRMQVSMMGANAYTNADDFFSYQGKPPRPEPDADCYGLGALYRLYEAHEGWVFLACLFEEEWQSFCSAVGREDLLTDPRFDTDSNRKANDAALADILSALFRARPASEWEELLIPCEVACVQAAQHTMGSFFEDSQHAWDNQFTRETDHLRFGTYWRHSGMAHFSLTPGRYGPGVLAGQHTRTLLRELGYKNDDILDLKTRGVVGWEEP